jgi:hypothetical protein
VKEREKYVGLLHSTCVAHSFAFLICGLYRKYIRHVCFYREIITRNKRKISLERKDVHIPGNPVLTGFTLASVEYEWRITNFILDTVAENNTTKLRNNPHSVVVDDRPTAH